MRDIYSKVGCDNEDLCTEHWNMSTVCYMLSRASIAARPKDDDPGMPCGAEGVKRRGWGRVEVSFFQLEMSSSSAWSILGRLASASEVSSGLTSCSDEGRLAGSRGLGVAAAVGEALLRSLGRATPPEVLTALASGAVIREETITCPPLGDCNSRGNSSVTFRVQEAETKPHKNSMEYKGKHRCHSQIVKFILQHREKADTKTATLLHQTGLLLIINKALMNFYFPFCQISNSESFFFPDFLLFEL